MPKKLMLASEFEGIKKDDCAAIEVFIVQLPPILARRVRQNESIQFPLQRKPVAIAAGFLFYGK